MAGELLYAAFAATTNRVFLLRALRESAERPTHSIFFTTRPGRAWSGAFQAEPGKQDGWLKKAARPSLRRATEGELEGKLPPK